MKELILYKKDSCPFCQKVLRFMAKNGIEIPMKDVVEDRANMDYLRKHGGDGMVPCLFIDGKALYESDDIIDFLDRELLDSKGDRSTIFAGGGMQCPF